MNTIEYQGNLFNLDNRAHKNYLIKKARESGKTLVELIAQGRLEQARKKVTKINGVETYEKPDGTIYYLENDEPLISDRQGRPLPPGQKRGEATIMGIETYEGMDGTIRYKANDMPLKADEMGRPLPPLPKQTESVEVTAQTPFFEQLPAIEQAPAAIEQAPASAVEGLTPAMLEYYKAKDATDGTKLAEWATNYKDLARKNYEYQASRGRIPEEHVALPEIGAQAFKNTFIDKAFNNGLSASDAQLPDFSPGSTNLNFIKSNDVAKSSYEGNEYTDFSRNNITPGEVQQQKMNIEMMEGIEDMYKVDYSKLYKSFDPGNLL